MKVLRHLALNFLERNKTNSLFKQKRFRAGHDDSLCFNYFHRFEQSPYPIVDNVPIWLRQNLLIASQLARMPTLGFISMSLGCDLSQPPYKITALKFNRLRDTILLLYELNIISLLL